MKKEETETNKRQCPAHALSSVQEGIRVTMEERICERDE